MSQLRVDPLSGYLKNTFTETFYNKAFFPLKSLSQKVAAATISGIGNFPFYGVSSSFGNRYSKVLGPILGGSEYISYFCFRIRNFEELFQNLFSKKLEIEGDPLPDQEAILPAEVARSDEPSKPENPSRNWKAVAKAVTIDIAASAMGLIGQIPFLILVYNGNGKKVIYPIMTGISEGAFTILSLLKSFQTSPKKEDRDEDLENKRGILIDQINRFLEELPSKYNNPDFCKKISSILSEPPSPKTEKAKVEEEKTKAEEERAKAIKALLDLVLEAKGLPELPKGSRDRTLSIFAKGVGFLACIYVTAVNAVVTYKGIKDWNDDEEGLAITTAVAVSVFNFKFLAELCMSSAFSYYKALRDIAKKQYRFPITHTISPVAWYVGRAASTALSWLSFGTTATGARDYFPKKAGEALIGPAPFSSAFILTDNLQSASDELILWAKSRSDPKIKLFAHLHQNLVSFRDKVKSAHPEILRKFLEQFPHLKRQPRPRASSDLATPLLDPSLLELE